MNRVLNSVLPANFKKDEQKLLFTPCLQCGIPITDGYYGAWADGGVCSKTCNILYARKPKNFGEPK